MSSENKEMSLQEKLVEIRKVIPYAKKDATAAGNSRFKYDYVSGTQVLTAIKNKMNELGVLLYPHLTAPSVNPIPVNDVDQKALPLYPSFLFYAAGSYVWADSKEEISVHWAFCGADADPAKAMGKALTYAERYFLLKYLNIPTDSEDPDTYISNHGIASEPLIRPGAKLETKPASPPKPKATKKSAQPKASALQPLKEAAPTQTPAPAPAPEPAPAPAPAPEQQPPANENTSTEPAFEFPTFEPDGSYVGDERVDVALNAFKKLKVTLEHLESVLGTASDKWNEEAMTALTEIYATCVSDEAALASLLEYK